MLKAIGCRAGFTDSPINTAEYDLKVNEVTFTPTTGGLVTNPPVELSMDTSTDLASIYYTDDGSLPVCNVSNEYTGTINLVSDTNVSYRAIACRQPDFEDSNERDIAFNITGTLPQPNINKNLNLLLLTTAVTISTSGSPASQTICYRTGGTSPSCSLAPGNAPNNLGGSCASGSTQYTGQFTVGTGTTIRARTCRANWIQSPVNVN